ncbi:Csu type fimbrial protein [Serratia aquatilis]|uniref:Spore coat U domain-containing protein n=1 Tax=Serratia aquatilis TaxID=1737515 RepID=A0ABV6EHJ7_9GAMM
MKHHFFKRGSLSLLLMMAIPVIANASVNSNSISGEISVSLNVLPGCVVKSAQQPSDLSAIADGQQWMTLTFPDTGATAGSQLTAQDKMNVQCTAGAQPSLTLDAGKQGDKDIYNMLNEDNKTKMPYTIATDQEGTNVIKPNQPIKIASSGDVAIYAKVTLPENAQAGKYMDTIKATISW